jgi:hypothetical protein
MTMTTLMSLPAFSAQSSPRLTNKQSNQSIKNFSTVTSSQTQRQGGMTLRQFLLGSFLGNQFLLGPYLTGLPPHQLAQCMLKERKIMPHMIWGTQCHIEKVLDNLADFALPGSSPETLNYFSKRLADSNRRVNDELGRRALEKAGVQIIQINPQ